MVYSSASGDQYMGMDLVVCRDMVVGYDTVHSVSAFQRVVVPGHAGT